MKNELEVPVSGQAVGKKYKDLISKYRKSKEASRTTGNSRQIFAYSHVFDDVIGFQGHK